MMSFKTFLEGIMTPAFLAKLINQRAEKTPKLRLSCDYDGVFHEGFIERAYSDNPPGTLTVEYKGWSESEGTYIPMSMFIYDEDISRFFIGKDYDGKDSLQCKFTKSVNEEQEIYAKKIENAPEWSPAVAEYDYKIGDITFSASKGLGSVPINGNIWYEGIVVFMKPSTFLKLALDDKGTQEPTSMELEQLAKEGYAIGIPWLDFKVDEKGNSLPKITGHEGRGRMRMIRRVLGDEPIPVHMRVGGGMRSRDIRPEMVDEIKQGLNAEGGGIVKNPVTRVFVSPDGRFNAPGVEM